MLARALPGNVVDNIRDGVARADLRQGGDGAVWRALVSAAASAVQRGWTEPEWAALVGDLRSVLGRQARLKHGHTERTRADYERMLQSAWTTASKWAAQAPDPAAITAEIVDRIAATRNLASDYDADLSDTERRILHRAAEVAERNGTDRPALPRRELMAATGTSWRQVSNALGHLEELGLLTLAERGRPAGSSAARRRANLYRLAPATTVDAYLYRGPRSVAHPPSSMAHPEDGTTGPRHRSVAHHQPGGPHVVTLTISSTDPEAIAQAVSSLAGLVDLSVYATPSQLDDPAPDNVLPLCRSDSKDRSA